MIRKRLVLIHECLKVKAPEVGYGYSWFGTLTGKQPINNVREALIEGYRKVWHPLRLRCVCSRVCQFPKGFFKIKLYPYGPVTVLTDQNLIKELKNAPDRSLDFMSGAARVSRTIPFAILLLHP